MSIKPEHILPDDVNSVIKEGISIRKGTVGAFLANAEILNSPQSTANEQQEALNAIRQLAPALIALGLHRHVIWRNEAIKEIFEEVKQNLNLQ